MKTRDRRQALRVMVAIVLSVAGGTLAFTTSSGADVATVTGSAYGYRAFNLTLFGGAQPDVGPTPIVTLAPNAGNSPQTATAGSGLVFIAETAVVMTSDAINVSTSGQLGPGGFVTSTASLQNLNKSTTQPAETGGEVLTADNLSSTCTANESGVSGSAMLTNGTLRTDSGFAVNDDPDYDDPGEIAPVFINLPANPTPNQTFEGLIRFSSTGTPDRFTVVLNEQIVGVNSITVNAAHIYFGVPSGTRLRGDLILGQVVCGVTIIPGSTTTSSTTSSTVAPTTTSSTVAPTTTSSTVAPTTTSSTVAPTTTSTSTSTTVAPTTTSTSTSTTVAPTTTSTSTSTTVAPTTTSTSTSTTVAPTTTSTSTSTTVAPTTTSTSTSTTVAPTTSSSSTSTTRVAPSGICAQLQAIRAQINAQITALEAAIVQALPASQRAAILATLEATRARSNAAIDRLLASFCA